MKMKVRVFIKENKMANIADFIKAIPINIKDKGLHSPNKKTNVELSEDKTPKIDKKKKVTTNWRSKDELDWNKKDIIKYWFDKYFEKFGKNPGNFSALPAHYQILEGITFMLEKAMNIEKAPIPFVKYYIDWVFETGAIDGLLNNKFCTMQMLKKERAIQNFVSYVKQQPEIEIKKRLGELTIFDTVDTMTVIEAKESLIKTKEINLADVENAYAIHSQYFIENFGIIIPIIYLVNIKKKTQLEAEAYVKKAYDKLKNKDKVIAVTKSFQPYPKWFENKNTELQLEYVDENEKFNQLRSI